MARVKVLQSTDPTAANLLQAQVSYMLAFVLITYNTVLYITNCFCEGSSIDCLIKWLMQIVIFGGIGMSAWYAY
jgi:hypothetical protein